MINQLLFPLSWFLRALLTWPNQVSRRKRFLRRQENGLLPVASASAAPVLKGSTERSILNPVVQDRIQIFLRTGRDGNEDDETMENVMRGTKRLVVQQ